MRMWMIRSEGGSLYDTFRERGVASVGWSQLESHVTPGFGRERLIALCRAASRLVAV